MPHNTNSAVSQATETAKALAKQKSQLESELAELLEALSTVRVSYLYSYKTYIYSR